MCLKIENLQRETHSLEHNIKKRLKNANKHPICKHNWPLLPFNVAYNLYWWMCASVFSNTNVHVLRFSQKIYKLVKSDVGSFCSAPQGPLAVYCQTQISCHVWLVTSGSKSNEGPLHHLYCPCTVCTPSHLPISCHNIINYYNIKYEKWMYYMQLSIGW